MNTAVKTQAEQQSRMVKKQNKKNPTNLILKKQMIAIKVTRDWKFHVRKMTLTCTEKK